MKKLISVICFLFLVSCFVPNISSATLVDDLQTQIQQKQQEIERLEQQATEYKKQLETTQNQKDTLNNQISLIDARVKKLQNDISITSTQISAATLKIEELSLDIDQKQNEIDKKNKEISDAIQTLAEYDRESLMEIVLSRTDFSDFINQVRYLELLQENVQKDITELKTIKSNMEQDKNTAQAQKNQLASLQGQLKGQKSIVDNQKQEKSTLLVQTKGQEKQYQTLLNDTLRKEQEIDQLIFDLEDKIKSTLDPNSTPEARPGVLSWPLNAVITQGYGCIVSAFARKSYPACNEGKGNGGFHNGIDLSTSYGTPIESPRDGKILAIGNCGKYAYGKWILVEHDDKLTTLYGHMSAYGEFKTGDAVKRGDIIGYEGSTGYSTGAHLHFTVYASETVQVEKTWYGTVPIGAPLDPTKYLPQT